MTLGLCFDASLGTETERTCRCRSSAGGFPPLPVRVMVTHVGGPTYNVLCAVEKGGTCRFSYSRLTDGATAVSYAPVLGEKGAAFLLGELEKRLGRMLLRGAVRSPRSMASTGLRDERPTS